MEQASNIHEETGDADDVSVGGDEDSSVLQQDDALKEKPQEGDESGQGEAEQSDVSHVEDTGSKDIGAPGSDDTAESGNPTEAPETGQSASDEMESSSKPNSPKAELRDLNENSGDISHVEDISSKDIGATDSDDTAEAGIPTKAPETGQSLSDELESSSKPNSPDLGEKESQDAQTLTADTVVSVKECEKELQSTSIKQSIGEMEITKGPSETPRFESDVGDGLEVGADGDREELGERSFPLPSSENKEEEPSGILISGDYESGDGHNRFGRSTPDEQNVNKGDDLEGSSSAGQIISEQEETESSLMDQIAERRDEGGSEDIGDTSLLQPCESSEHEPGQECASDEAMDTSEADLSGTCPSGDKEMDASGIAVEGQETRGGATGTDDIGELCDKTNDGGHVQTNLNEEGEKILDQQMTENVESDGIVGEEGIGDTEKPLTSQEEDKLLSEDTQNHSSQLSSHLEENRATQDANLSLDEPMDTSEDGGETTTKESDGCRLEDAMETNDQMTSCDSNSLQPGVSDDSSHEQALSASIPAHTENTLSGAEALVRGSVSNNESSVQIKQEILTEVMTEVHAKSKEVEPEPAKAPEGSTDSSVLEKDQDVKPSKAELDRALDQALSKVTSVGGASLELDRTSDQALSKETSVGETESTPAQAKPAEGLDQALSKETSVGETESTPAQAKPAEGKKSKGSSITSIVGRLFNKKEEEARKRKETSPVEPPDEIASVPFKISGVKSLAAPDQAAKQQQRQEMRQTAASPIIIANVTSLASEVEKCSKCSKQISSIESAYKWQKELFCSFSCLDTTRITSTKTVTCDSCTVVLHPRIRNVHFAKVGKEMKEFCSTRCAKNSEESPKLCPGCGKDVSTSSNPVLAQTGSEGIFFEFCTQDCVNQYEERILNDANKDHEIAIAKQIKGTCTECENSAVIRYEFSFHQVKKLFCSEACFDSFRMKYNTKIDRCAYCKCMCYNDSSAGLMMVTDGVTHQFCSEKCKSTFARPCSYCSKKRSVRVMITTGDGEYFCSVVCRDRKKPGAPPASIYECLAGSTGAVVPSPGLLPLPPLNSIHVPSAATGGVPSATGGVPQSISSNQQPHIPQQQQQQAQVHQQTQQVSTTGPQPTKCDHCQKLQRPLYHLTMSDRTLRDFCSYNCVISFQAQFNVPPVTLPEETLLLRCHKCQRGFNTRPFVLDYEDKTSLFCSELCLEDYKRTNCVFVQCDQCHQDKILFEKTHFCGEPRTFCSQGCMLLFKQEIVQTLGLQCIVCDFCAQMCKQELSAEVGGIKRHFCRAECQAKYEAWFYKVARCDGCKNTGRQLTEKFMWRGDMKHVCNQQCVLLFYTQQNIPNVTTQLPEPIPTSTAQHATPTIAKVMSLAPMERLGAPRTIVKENKKSYTNKQTQITTNTVYIKPPPPPPSDLPPPPKMVRNKITSCRPIQITKATMCRPIMKEMGVGTDFPKVPAVLPIPFPVFIPVPMQMYTSHIPHPVAIPVPVPTPMFVPVAARDCDRLLKTMQEIKERIPSDPLEAELLMMAAAVVSDEDDSASELGAGQDGTRKRGSVSEKEGSVSSLGQRTRASLVDQAMVECGIMDEPIDEMGVDEILASLSSPEVSDDILLMNDDLEDEEDKEKKELLAELVQGLDVLGHIPESAGDPPPPPPVTKKVKRITLKKKPKKRKRTMRKKKPPAPPRAPSPPVDTGLGLRRSSRAAKRTKYYTDDDSQEEEADEEEYEPSISSSSEEEIVEMVDEVIDPPPDPPIPTLPPTDEAWVNTGLLAYKLFVMGLDESLKPISQRIKADILECSPDVIHRGLILFIRDARQPDGQPYPPETLLLMCLSIQRHLTDSGRLDNFLAGPNFDMFRDCLHRALAPWTPIVHPTSGLLLNSRINEEMMWASQQLGAHSPHVLLSTVFFFNCRNLRMRSVEEHSRLAFFRMQKLVKKASSANGKVCLLRYFPPKKKNEAETGKKGSLLNIGRGKKREFDPETLDQTENTENPLRCPVKLYEFYLSKCPESIKMRNEIFYLLPEHSCIPDSPVWYSATKLPDDEMERMLRRYGMIQEVQAGWQQKMKEEEEEERAAELEREKTGAGDGGDEGGNKAPDEGSSVATEQATDDQSK